MFTEAMFSSDALPLVPPALTGLFTEFMFQDTVAGVHVDVNGIITELTCTAGCDIVPPPTRVPEPATLSLLAGGLGILVMHRRRRRNNAH